MFVYLCWWLMTKKKISPTLVMLILVGVAFVGVLVGFFDPGLSY
ncbi:MAG: PTS system mannose/fructose/sorbose family transporter subunit IID [Coriobacteriales bacterium]|nr:PTS system mannose/fructose/sorbose family transporter subunit IID [Coriobacteriales bacterium]MDD5800602.1 PTS system mannose/fructose/sorbose family transporter subunit IID [Coriobacteriales bacterium]